MLSRRTLRRAAVLAAAGTLLLTAACGSDDGDADADATSTTAPTTTATDGSTSTAGEGTEPGGSEGAGAEALAEWGERGPYGVGSTQMALADGRRVAIWYPAEAGAGTEEPLGSFDIASLLSPELQSRIPAEVRPVYPEPARPGAEPDREDGPYPVILFSHGFAGFPEQSLDLTTHLASWGYVVAAPDHVERSLSGILGTAAVGVPPMEDADVLAATLDLVEEEAGKDTSPLGRGMVDTEKVGVAGHSAGAGATYAFAGADERVDAFATYSVGTGSDDEPRPDAPALPGLVMLGDRDGVIEPDATRTVYEGLSSPKYLAEIADSGHLVFSDLCRIGADQGGIIGIAESIDLPIPENFKALGTDGCGDDFLPVDEAFPVIDALSVAFFRAYLDEEEAAADALVAGPVDLGTEAEVTLDAEP